MNRAKKLSLSVIILIVSFSLLARVCSGDGVTGDGGYRNVTSDKIITGEVTGERMLTGEAFLTGEIEKKTCFTQRIILQKMMFCEPYMLEHI